MATVLVVDSDPHTREYLAQLVEILGHEGVRVDSGAQALRVIAHQAPQLVIADVDLPRMNGFELLEEMRSRPALARTPVLFYTLRNDAETLRNARSLGVQAILQKPGEPAEVVNAIRTALESSPPA